MYKVIITKSTNYNIQTVRPCDYVNTSKGILLLFAFNIFDFVIK